MREDYRRALDAAVREYERAIADRAALEARIAQLRQTIGTLTRLCGFAPTIEFGLTEACRMVLRNSPTPVTPVEVRDRLVAAGVDLDRYASPLAAIHTVLKRLAASGEAHARRPDETRRTAYLFRPPAPPLAAAPVRRVVAIPRPPSNDLPARRGRRSRA